MAQGRSVRVTHGVSLPADTTERPSGSRRSSETRVCHIDVLVDRAVSTDPMTNTDRNPRGNQTGIRPQRRRRDQKIRPQRKAARLRIRPQRKAARLRNPTARNSGEMRKPRRDREIKGTDAAESNETIRGGKLQPNGRRGKTDPQGWHIGQTGSLHRTTDMRGAVRGIINSTEKLCLRNKVKRPGPVAPPAMGWGAPDSKHPVQPPSQWMVQRHPEDRGGCVCVCVPNKQNGRANHSPEPGIHNNHTRTMACSNSVAKGKFKIMEAGHTPGEALPPANRRNG